MQATGLLDGKVALVTGGASGIGRAIVQALSGAGARVAVSDKNGVAAAALRCDRCRGDGAELDVYARATATVFDATAEVRRARHRLRQCRASPP